MNRLKWSCDTHIQAVRGLFGSPLSLKKCPKYCRNSQLGFISTPIIGTDAVHDRLRTAHPAGCDDRSFSLHPCGLKRIQPGAFPRQSARQHAHPLPRLRDGVILLLQTRPDLVAEVPRRVIQCRSSRAPPLSRIWAGWGARRVPAGRRYTTPGSRRIRNSSHPL